MRTLIEWKNSRAVQPVDLRFLPGKAIKTGIVAGNTVLLQAYDVGAGSYTTFGTLSAHATDPTFKLSNVTLEGTILASGTVIMPALTLGGTISGGNQNIANLGRIGLGNTAINTDYYFALDVDATITDDSQKVGINADYRIARTAAAYTGRMFGGNFIGGVAAANNQNFTDATFGIVGVAAQTFITAAATGTVTGAADLITYANYAAMTVTNRYGVYVMNAAGAGTLTNQYGIYFESLTKGGTLNYMIHGAADITVGMGINIASGKTYQVAGTPVVGAQGAAVADVSDGLLATTITQLNALLARLRTHGLIAAA